MFVKKIHEQRATHQSMDSFVNLFDHLNECSNRHIHILICSFNWKTFCFVTMLPTREIRVIGKSATVLLSNKQIIIHNLCETLLQVSCFETESLVPFRVCGDQRSEFTVKHRHSNQAGVAINLNCIQTKEVVNWNCALCVFHTDN